MISCFLVYFEHYSLITKKRKSQKYKKQELAAQREVRKRNKGTVKDEMRKKKDMERKRKRRLDENIRSAENCTKRTRRQNQQKTTKITKMNKNQWKSIKMHKNKCKLMKIKKINLNQQISMKVIIYNIYIVLKLDILIFKDSEILKARSAAQRACTRSVPSASYVYYFCWRVHMPVFFLNIYWVFHFYHFQTHC